MGEYKITILSEENWRTKLPDNFHLAVGLELEVRGDYDESNKQIKATTIKLGSDNENVEGTGLVENKDALSQSDHSWSGTLLADGEVLTITPATAISPTKTEKKREAAMQSAASTPVTLEEVGPDTFVHYAGARQLDFSIAAKQLEIQQNVLDKEEAAWGRQLDPQVKDTPGAKDAMLTLWDHDFYLVRCPEADAYFSKLAAALLPPRQKELPDDSPLRIHFRFYLVDSNHLTARFFPNGVVLVGPRLLDETDNEAQLAFLLGRGMAATVEKQEWRNFVSAGGQSLAARLAGIGADPLTFAASGLVGDVAVPGLRTGFYRELQDQADRLALQYMANAGCDPREALAVVQATDKRHATEELGFARRRPHALLG